MDINSLIKDPYIIIFVGGLIFYLSTVFLFIEKLENKIKDKMAHHDKSLIEKNDGTILSTKKFIDMFDSLRENRMKYAKVQNLVDGFHWVGILFIVGALLGFILEQAQLNQDIAIAIMSGGFLYTFILLIYFILWYRKNR